MIILSQGLVSQTIVLTLNEKRTTDSPVYTFTATHVTKKDQVIFTLGEDLSSFPERFNEFEITNQFDNKADGQWMYLVEDQGGEVENGRLIIKKQTQFSYDGYAPETTYNGYRG